MMRKMSGVKTYLPELGKIGNMEYDTLTGRSEMEEKRLMRHAILKEIKKAVEEQTKGIEGQASMDHENDKMTGEGDSTSVMIGEVSVAETTNSEGVVFTDERSWTVDELLAFGTLLDYKKLSYEIKWPKEN